MEVFAPLSALLGVVLGSWLSRMSAERNRLRDLRLERYTELLKAVDAGNVAIDAVFAALADVDVFESRGAWEAAVDDAGIALDARAGEVRDTTAVLSLFASHGVADATIEILQFWRDLMEALSQLPIGPVLSDGPAAQDIPASGPSVSVARNEVEDAVDPTGSAADTESAAPWPDPRVRQAAIEFARAREGVNTALVGLRGALVRRLRTDLGVDRASQMRRVVATVRERIGGRRPDEADQPTSE